MEDLRLHGVKPTPPLVAPTLASLLAPLPKPPMSIACPPDYCKVSVKPSRASFVRLGKLAMEVFERNNDANKLESLIQADAKQGTLLPISQLMESLKNDKINSKENLEAVKVFRLAVRAVFVDRIKHLNQLEIYRTSQDAVNETGAFLTRMAEATGVVDPCVCVMAKFVQVFDQAINTIAGYFNIFEFHQRENSPEFPAPAPQKFARPATLNSIAIGWKKKKFNSTNLPTFIKDFDAIVLALIHDFPLGQDLYDVWKFIGATGLPMLRNCQEQIRYGDSIEGFQKPGQKYVVTHDIAGSLAITARFSASVGTDSKTWLSVASKQAGDVFFGMGNWKNAISSYAAATALAPNYFDCYANSAAARLRLADSDETQYPQAIADCTYALEFSPNNTKALFRRGLALAHLKMWKLAITDFERAIKLDPRSPAVAELAEARKHV